MKRLGRGAAMLACAITFGACIGCGNRTEGTIGDVPAAVDTTMSLEASKRWFVRIYSALGADSLDVPLFFVPALQVLTPGTNARSARFLAVKSDSGQIVTVFTSEFFLRSYVEDVNRTEHLDAHTIGYAVRRFSARTASQLADQVEGSGLRRIVIDRSFYCSHSQILALDASSIRDPHDAVTLWVAARSSSSRIVERWSRRGATAMRAGRWLDAKDWLVDISRCVPGEARTLVMLGVCEWKLGDRQVVAAIDSELGRFDPPTQAFYRKEIGVPSAGPLTDKKAAALIDSALSIPIRAMKFAG